MKKQEDVVYHYGYYRTAKRLKMARYITLLVFLLFTLFLFMFFRQDMTLNHFRYLLRNFDVSPHSSASSGDTIYYDGDKDSKFGFVAGGLACVTDTRVFVTDRSSGITFSAYHGYSEPRAVFSDKYMLVYDRTGSSLSVYNAFACLETFEYNGTVLSAAVSDDGTVAVAVAEKGQYYSTVYVYNSRFEQVNKLSKYKYVTSLALSPDGDCLAVGSVYSGESAGQTASEILLLKVGEKSSSALYQNEGEAVWQVSFFEEGGFAALTDKSILFFDENGKKVGESAYDEEAPSLAYLGQEGAVLLFQGSDARSHTLYTYNEKGKLLWKGYDTEGAVKSIAEDEAYYYFLVENELLTLPKGEGEGVKVPLSEEDGVLIADDDAWVYFATSSAAKHLDAKTAGR